MTALALSTAIGTALVAGIFFAFSAFVMNALERLEVPEGVAAMQSINVVVLNPWFFGAFFGAGILCIASVVAWLDQPGPARAAIMIGAVSYLVGCIGVTIGGNVPLNDRLAAVGPEQQEAPTIWEDYLRRWTRWNHVRTAASLVAACAFAFAAAVG